MIETLNSRCDVIADHITKCKTMEELLEKLYQI